MSGRCHTESGLAAQFWNKKGMKYAITERYEARRLRGEEERVSSRTPGSGKLQARGRRGIPRSRRGGYARRLFAWTSSKPVSPFHDYGLKRGTECNQWTRVKFFLPSHHTQGSGKLCIWPRGGEILIQAQVSKSILILSRIVIRVKPRWKGFKTCLGKFHSLIFGLGWRSFSRVWGHMAQLNWTNPGIRSHTRKG